MNLTLYKKELKGSWKMMVVFAAIMSMYISMIISMYDPELAQTLKQFGDLMPEIMAAVGMNGATDTLMKFMATYLYGMILLVFPMVYSIIRANSLVAKYTENGSMACLLSSAVTRRRVVCTQWAALMTGVILLIGYCTILELTVAHMLFPEDLETGALLRMNIGLLFLQFFIASLCFLSSCIFNEVKYSIAFGAGIPVVMYVLQMLANMGGKLKNIKYATFFTLFQPNGLAQSEFAAWTGVWALLAAAVIISISAAVVFQKKDLPL